MSTHREVSNGLIRGVCIGTGYFSQFQYDAWSRIPEVDIAAVSDLNKESADKMMHDYGLERYYADYKEMIDQEQPDFVDIITRPEIHYEMCKYAAKKGVHIICQKPLAPTYEESEKIVKVAEDYGVRLMIHENFRWQPWYREVKKTFLNQKLGNLHSIYFRLRPGDGWGDDAYLNRQPYFREYPRLLMYETGVHFIDVCRFLGGEIKSVYAYLKRLNPVIEGEDSGIITLILENGASVVFDANRYNEIECEDPRYTMCEFRIDGSKGHLEMDIAGNISTKMLGQATQPHDYRHNHHGFAGDCCYALQKHFVECMISGEPFESTGADYLKTLQVVEACYQSAESGQVVLLT